MDEPTDADRALVAREVARLRGRGTDQAVALASLLTAVPVDLAARFVRDEMLIGLGGKPRADYWLRIQELNFFAHQARRRALRLERLKMGPGYRSVMAVTEDRGSAPLAPPPTDT